MKRWRGLGALVRDAVEHGSRAVERIQKETAARPFAILEAIPGIAGPTRVVRVIHDASVSGVHGTIRVVNRGVGAVVDAVLAAVEDDAAVHDGAPHGSGTRGRPPGYTAGMATRPPMVVRTLRNGEPDDGFFDLAFWQGLGPAAIFAASWEMVGEVRAMRGEDGDEPRLQRSAVRVVRRGG